MAFSGVFGGLHTSRMARGMGNIHSGGNKNICHEIPSLDRHENITLPRTQEKSQTSSLNFSFHFQYSKLTLGYLKHATRYRDKKNKGVSEAMTRFS